MKKNKLLTLSIAALLGFGTVAGVGIKFSGKKATVASNTTSANSTISDKDGQKIAFPNHVRREGEAARSSVHNSIGVRVMDADEGKKSLQFVAALTGYSDLSSATFTRIVTGTDGSVIKASADIAVTHVYTALAAPEEVTWDVALSAENTYFYMIYTLNNIPEAAAKANVNVSFSATYTDGEKTPTVTKKARVAPVDPSHEHAGGGKFSVHDVDSDGALVAQYCLEDGELVNQQHVAAPQGSIDVPAESVLDGVEGLFSVTNGTTYPWAYDSETNSIHSTNATKGSSKSDFTITALANITIRLTSNVNSESNWDYLSNSFESAGSHTYVTGSNMSGYYSSKVSGKDAQTITVEHEIAMTAGSTFSWSYSKDSNGNKGSDKAWITDVSVAADSIAVSAGDLSAVTFDTVGGSTIAPSVLFTGKKVAAPAADPEKEGYVFDGWYADSAYAAEFDFENTAITEDTVVYAKWIVAKTVTINANNGTDATTAIVGEGKTYDAGKPEKDGFKFLGWYTDEACTEGNEFTSTTVVNADVSIYAKWEVAPVYAGRTYYGCEYYGKSSGGSYVENISIDYEDHVTGKHTGVISGFDAATGAISWGPSAESATYGQMIYKEGIIVEPYYNTSKTLTTSGDIMIYSRYNASTFKGKSYAFQGASTNEFINRVFQTQNSEGETQLNFLFEGALYTNVTLASLTGTPDTATLALDSLKDVEIISSNGTRIAAFGYNGSKFVVADALYGAYTGTLGNLTINGAGTAKVVTGSGEDEVTTTYTYVATDAGIRMTSGATVYDVTFDGTTYTAVAPTTTITYDTVGGNEIDAGTFTTSLAVGELPTPTKEGYIFKGWYLEDDYKTLVTASYVAGADVTLYAKWAESATLSFESNGGTLVEAMTVVTGDPITAPADPTKEGYRFDGWYNDEGCTELFDFAAGVPATKTVYAKWVATVTVTLHNATGPNTDSSVVTIDQGSTYTATTPSIPGYTGFGGWYTNEACTVAYEAGAVDANINLYAKWTGKYTNDAANYIDSLLGDAASYVGWGNVAAWSGGYSWNYDAETNTMTPNNQGKSSSYATFSITFAKAGTFTFDYACSSEPSYDGLEVQHKADASASSWTKDLALASGTKTGTVTLEVTAGEIVSFYYKKDSSGDRNDDTVRLTNFTWTEPVVAPAYAGAWTDGTNAVVFNDDGTTGTVNGESFTYSWNDEEELYMVTTGDYAGSFFSYFPADEDGEYPEAIQCMFMKDGAEEPTVFTMESGLTRGEPSEPEAPTAPAYCGTFANEGYTVVINENGTVTINGESGYTYTIDSDGDLTVVDDSCKLTYYEGLIEYNAEADSIEITMYGNEDYINEEVLTRVVVEEGPSTPAYVASFRGTSGSQGVDVVINADGTLTFGDATYNYTVTGNTINAVCTTDSDLTLTLTWDEAQNKLTGTWHDDMEGYDLNVVLTKVVA